MYISLFLWLACADTDNPEVSSNDVAEVVESISHTSQLGPVTAEVSLSPKEPKLGTPMTLTLRVQSTEGVEVELPPFGEALGRFQIVDFEPNASTSSNVFIQRYTLQAPMSGLQTIPALRVVFFDTRDGQEKEEQEVLTEEISLQIASLLEEDAPLDVKPARGRLEPKVDMPIWVWLGAGSLFLGLVSFVGWRYYRRWQAKEVVRSAYENALEGLALLEQQTDVAIDVYYAQLSLILRRYIDARFGIAVLEKTTPEFIQIAQQSTFFDDEQLDFLSKFLQRADDVKYAQQQPDLAEGETEVSLIRRFLEETKIKEKEEDAA